MREERDRSGLAAGAGCVNRGTSLTARGDLESPGHIPAWREANWRSAALGIASATFFALAAIGFRAAVVGVDSSSRALAASLILVVGLAIQTATLVLYLGFVDRAGARKIIDAWRSSLFAGFMGALASQFWFLAFALTDAARVRTLALIEAPLAQVVSLKLFHEPPSLREGLGMALIVIAAGILVWTAE